MTLDNALTLLRAHWADALAVLFAVIAVWQTFRANRFAKQVARHEGSFDHPRLTIKMFGWSKTNEFLILAPISPKPLLFPVPLTITNQGAATAYEIQLLVQANEDLLPYSREWLRQEQPDDSGVVRAVFLGREGNVNTVSFHVAHLHPGMPLNLVNTAILHSPTFLRSKVPVTTADGVAGKLEYELDFSFSVNVVAVFKSSRPIGTNFKISILDTTDTPAAEALEAFWRRRAKTIATASSAKRSSMRGFCVVSVATDRPTEKTGELREVNPADLRISDGLMSEDGLWVPSLGVALGDFENAPRYGRAKRRFTLF